jgi:TRAP transporter TAXI family solute receptor
MNDHQNIRVGTSEKDGTFWSEGEAIATLLKRDHAIDAEILDAGAASIENARRLDAGLIDLGFMASNWIGRAYRADAPFDAGIQIRNVTPANFGAMFFIVRNDSSLQQVRDMVGKRVAIGPKCSGMVQHIHTIFGVLGISFDEFTPVYMSFEEGGQALKAGDIDAQWQCPYPNPVMKDTSDRMDVRVLHFDSEDLSKVLREVDFYRHSVMPAGFFRGIEQDTEQLAVVNIVAAHERTDFEIVRKFVATMLSNLDELAEINQLFKGLGDLYEPLRSDGQAALEFGGAPMHPGAVQAYKDAGYLS